MTPRTSLGPAVFVILALGCGGAAPADTETTPAALPDIEGPWTEAAIPRVRVPLDGSPGRGAAEPLVTMVIFSDFECRFCRDATPTLERLLAAYPDTLRVHFRHLPLPMHEHAELAAIAAIEAYEQAGDEGFWRMHDRLFANPDALALEGLIAHAQALELDVARFRIALRGRVHADRIEDDLVIADRVGAEGTPTFYVNGRPVLGALPFEEFRVVIDRERALAEEAITRGIPRSRVYDAAMRESLAEAPRRPPPEREARPRMELDRSVVYAVPVGDAPTLGPDDAPVTIVTFSDFECPFCARVLPTLAALRERFPDQIRLAFRHRPLPFHANAELAAAASMEAHAQAGDEAFWQMHDLLFENQRALHVDALVGYAQQLGLDGDRFRAALEDGTHEAAIEADNALAERLGARGTPSFFVNGRVLTGAQPLDAFAAAVEDGLARAAAERERGTAPSDVYAALIRDGSTEAVWREIEATPERLSLEVPEGAPRRGSSAPRLVIQMFSDFECPFCGRVEPTVERLLAAFPDVQLAFRHLPLPFHEHARDAAIAAIEVQRQLGDEGFFRYAAVLFENQGALTRPELVRHAVTVGADPARVGRALESEEHAPVIDRDMRVIVGTGMRIGTPAFLIGDRLIMGAQPYAAFEAAVREELARVPARD